jgi:hypothetical protein
MTQELTLTQNDASIVEIYWADAHAGEGRWGDLEETDSGEHIVRTCGYMIDEEHGGKKLHVTIAQSFTPDGFYDHVIYIPVGMVRTTTVMRPGNTANAMPQTLVT